MFDGKRLPDPVAEDASHVPVLIESHILLFLKGVEVAEGFLAQYTQLRRVISGSDEVPGLNVTTVHVSMKEFKQNLRNFWGMPFNHDGDDSLEEHYREADAGYVAPIPWWQGDIKLGSSYHKVVQ